MVDHEKGGGRNLLEGEGEDSRTWLRSINRNEVVQASYTLCSSDVVKLQQGVKNQSSAITSRNI